jgi:6-phosphogluconate dehydrogenase
MGHYLSERFRQAASMPTCNFRGHAMDIGLIGLAVMGENLVLNMERNGFRVAVYNRTGSVTDAFLADKAAGKQIKGARSLEELVGMLERPRRIMIMVKAGGPVDAVIDQLTPLLEPGDLIIDGGNSFFPDTDRRADALAAKGLNFVGSGVSGGEEGALWGPSMMPGGPHDAYALIEPIFTKIAAQVDDGPCVTYIGPRGAGHYVKMVHNGIEYGDMQLIAESYDLLTGALGLSNQELHEVFAEWNAGELSSYLIEITAAIFKAVDAETGQGMVDVILDKAGQKGTGKWTSQNALDLGAPTPTINTAVESRIMSSYKHERVEAAKILDGPSGRYSGERKALIDAVRDALYCSKVCSYAQGMALMQAASKEYGYELQLAEIARIWKGGCIIRAAFLGDISQAYQRNPELANLLLDDYFRERVTHKQAAWRHAVETGIRLGIPLPAFSASLAYYDAYRQARGPANLIQAQRDFFGAHTFERVDREGVFHHGWA